MAGGTNTAQFIVNLKPAKAGWMRDIWHTERGTTGAHQRHTPDKMHKKIGNSDRNYRLALQAENYLATMTIELVKVRLDKDNKEHIVSSEAGENMVSSIGSKDH